jgi:hypothetical protein
MSSEQRLAHERRKQLRQESLVVARSTAEKWAGTSVALLAALGFATIVQGGKQIRSLDEPYEYYVAAGVLCSLALAVLAILFAAIAAQGSSPTAMTKLTATELLTYEEDEAEKAAEKLSVSRRLLGLATILVIAAVGFLFYAPTDDEDPTQVLVVTGDGTVVCGELQSDVGRGEIRIKPEGQLSDVVVATGDLLSLDSVASCPKQPDDEEIPGS